MAVRRYTQAYGTNSRKQLLEVGSRSEAIWGDGIPATPTLQTTQIESAVAVRFRPKPGGFSGSFRLPTAWFMVAGLSDIRANQEYDFTVSHSNGISKTRHKGNGPTTSWGVPRYPFVNWNGNSVNVDPNTQARCRTEAMQKFLQGDLNLGVAIAEFNQTVGLLYNSISKLVRAYRKVLHGDHSGALRILGIHKTVPKSTISNHWLEYQYGWMPLLSDIYATQELLKSIPREKDMLLHVSRQIKNQLDHRMLCNPTFSSSLIDYRGSLQETCRTKLWARVSNVFAHNLASLGLTNPMLVAWEKVPFSFVIDWLLPIGNFLEAISAHRGLDFVAGFDDLLIEGSLSWEYKIPPGYHLVAGTPPGPWRNSMYAFQRRLYLTWPIPLPYWKNPLSSTHLANALALVTSLRK